MLFNTPTICRADSLSEIVLDADRIRWQALSFRAQKFGGTVEAEIKLSSLSLREYRDQVIPVADAPIQPTAEAVILLTVDTRIDSPGRGEVALNNRVWLDPRNGTPLQRVRLRTGEDEFLKKYRFTSEGVYRFSRQPQGDEAQLPPERWSRVREQFYRIYPSHEACGFQSEMSALIYLVAAAGFTPESAPVGVCMFGKRQWHRLELQPDGREQLELSYREVSQGKGVDKTATVDALRIRLETEPMDTDLDKDENFSFLGFTENVVFYLDIASGTPVQITGDMPVVRKAELKLREVVLR
jgi:hypothetical protein